MEKIFKEGSLSKFEDSLFSEINLLKEEIESLKEEINILKGEE